MRREARPWGRWLYFVLTALLAACAQPQGQAVLLLTAPPASLQLVDNTILVPVMLNGRGPFNMILDNGAQGGHVIDRSLAAELGMVPATPSRRNRSDGGEFDAAAGALATLEVANLRVQDAPVLVADLPEPLRRTSTGEPIAGFIGSPVFERFSVELNLVDNKLRFLDSDAADQAQPGLFVIKTQGPDNIVSASVNGRPLRLSLDLGHGASVVALSHSAATRMLGTAQLAAQPEFRAATAGGNISGRRLTLDDVQIGPVRRIQVAATSSPPDAAGNRFNDGYLGLPFFAGCRTRFNLSKHRIAMTCP